MDIVVFGATGFVGRLVAGYLAEHAPDGVSVGLAGRSREKLESAAELGVDWPLVVADAGDEASLAALAGGARVVCTTVGPYWPAGLKLVDACVAAGTDYVDLTGEILFVHESINRHDDAREAGARIVHSCGFDSIPSDLGVFLLHEAAGRARGHHAGREGAEGRLQRRHAGVAEGSDRRDPRRPDARRVMGDPNALAAGPGATSAGARSAARRPPPKVRLDRPVRDGELQHARRAPQRRAARLRPAVPLSRDLGVRQPADGDRRHRGLGALAGGLAFGPTRKLLDRVLPDPGEGPSEKTRESGYFKIEVHADGRRAKVAAKGDPGYAATAVMMGEAALCLALDELPDRFGVLTPATAMGGALVERLRAAGMTLTVE